MLHLQLMICGIQPLRLSAGNEILMMLGFVLLEALLVGILFKYRKQLMAAYREDDKA